MNSLKISRLKYLNQKFRLIIILIAGTIIVIYINIVGNSKYINVNSVLNFELKKPNLNEIPTVKNQDIHPNVSARYWALYDVGSSTLINGNNYDVKVPIASITKIITSIVVLDNSKIDEVVTVPTLATQVNGSRIELRSNERITVGSLLQGLLINSGNDAAYTLGYFIADKLKPSTIPEEKIGIFVELMNKKASELGLTSTIYFDPAGLDDNGKSTARDQGILISYALRNTIFTSIINKSGSVIKSIDGTIEHKLENSNRLVKEEMYYSGIIGGKTGFTPTSGHNLVTAASRNDHTLVAIIISTYSNLNTASAAEAKKLLDWG